MAIILLFVISWANYLHFKGQIMNKQNVSYLQEFLSSFRALLFGDFPEALEQYDIFDWQVFTIILFFVCVVLLNLLIAIIGDSYARVMTNIDQNYGHNMALNIWKYES